MHTKFGRSAFMGRIGAMSFAIILMMAGNSSASEMTLPDTYFGGTNSFNGSDVLENSGVYSFDVFGATAARSGNNLTVTIYTNYAGAVGAENTGLGYLFLGNGTPTLSGSPPYTTDTFTANPSRFQYAAGIPYNPTTTSGTGNVYQLNGTGSDVQTSYYGNTNGTFPPSAGTPATTSPSNGGYFRTNQAVGIIGNPSVVGSDTWSINAGTTTPTDHIGYTGTGTSSGDYSGDGTITFTLSGIFDPAGIDLGGTLGTFTLAWAMTCSNDIILATFILPPPSTQLSTPLPATLTLFASGLGALGLLGWRRKRKASSALAA
jgi:hypothetical protein